MGAGNDGHFLQKGVSENFPWFCGCPLKAQPNTPRAVSQCRRHSHQQTQSFPAHASPQLSLPWGPGSPVPPLHLGLAAPSPNSGRGRAKPQRRPLGFCGFRPDPGCYFRATSVFNLRMCVDQKEGPTHYFFSLGQMIKFKVLKNAQLDPKLCPIGK